MELLGGFVQVVLVHIVALGLFWLKQKLPHTLTFKGTLSSQVKSHKSLKYNKNASAFRQALFSCGCQFSYFINPSSGRNTKCVLSTCSVFQPNLALENSNIEKK